MKYSELIKELKKTCEIHREGGNHTIWRNKTTGEKFSVSRHKTEEVPTGTLKSIRKAAGLE